MILINGARPKVHEKMSKNIVLDISMLVIFIEGIIIFRISSIETLSKTKYIGIIFFSHTIKVFFDNIFDMFI